MRSKDADLNPEHGVVDVKSFTDLTQPELSVVILWRIFQDEIAMLPAKSGISSF